MNADTWKAVATIFFLIALGAFILGSLMPFKKPEENVSENVLQQRDSISFQYQIKLVPRIEQSGTAAYQQIQVSVDSTNWLSIDTIKASDTILMKSFTDMPYTYYRLKFKGTRQ